MNDKTFESIIIYTDGACTGNPGPGGWASVIVFPEGQVLELGDHNPSTTNNRMELVAGLKALQAIKDRTEPTVIYTDSVYMIRGITEWIWAWRSRGWKTSEGEEVSNQDIWRELFMITSERREFGLEWKFVKGHSGNPGNERCDEISVAFSKRKPIKLFNGPLLQYPFAIYDLPPDKPLPEIKQAVPKKAAYSYLSLLGGTVVRHKTWASCELRVKGQSGAKFKKAASAEDEPAILKTWGLDPARVTIQDDTR